MLLAINEPRCNTVILSLRTKYVRLLSIFEESAQSENPVFILYHLLKTPLQWYWVLQLVQLGTLRSTAFTKCYTFCFHYHINEETFNLIEKKNSLLCLLINWLPAEGNDRIFFSNIIVPIFKWVLTLSSSSRFQLVHLLDKNPKELTYHMA